MKLVLVFGVLIALAGVALAQEDYGGETTVADSGAEAAPETEDDPVAIPEENTGAEEPAEEPAEESLDKPVGDELPPGDDLPAADPESDPIEDEIPEEDEIISLPHLPVPRYDDYGDILWFPRIIGGSKAVMGEFPGKVSLQTRFGAHFCGGTLIHFSHILSAAHCVMTNRGIVNPTSVEIMAGDISIRRQNAGVNRVHRIVSHIFAHPQYSAITMENDIAVLRVSVPFVTVRGIVEPQPLGTIIPVAGTTCSLAGWGSTEQDSGSASPDLMRVDLEIVDTHRCNVSYQGMIGENMFCAGTMLGGRDACQGDSGGGLVCRNNIVGVVSFGYGCGKPRFPGVYVNVIPYSEFIQNAIEFDGTHQQVPTPTPIPDSATAIKPHVLVPLVICIALFVNKFS